MRPIVSRPRHLGAAQAATLLNVSDKTIRRWIDAEKIPFLKLRSGAYDLPVLPARAAA